MAGLLANQSGLLSVDEAGVLLLGEEGDPCCCDPEPCPCTPPYLSQSWYLAGCLPRFPGVEYRAVGGLGRVYVRYQAQGLHLVERRFPNGFRDFRREGYSAFLTLCYRVTEAGDAVESIGGYTAWSWFALLGEGPGVEREGTLVGVEALAAPAALDEGTYSTCLLRPAYGLVRPYAPVVQPEDAGLIGGLRIDCEPSDVQVPGGRVAWAVMDSVGSGRAMAIFDVVVEPDVRNRYLVRELATFTASWVRDISCRGDGGGGGGDGDAPDSEPVPGDSEGLAGRGVSEEAFRRMALAAGLSVDPVAMTFGQPCIGCGHG